MGGGEGRKDEDLLPGPEMAWPGHLHGTGGARLGGRGLGLGGR